VGKVVNRVFVVIRKYFSSEIGMLPDCFEVPEEQVKLPKLDVFVAYKVHDVKQLFEPAIVSAVELPVPVDQVTEHCV